MELILKEDVVNLGYKNDIVTVRPAPENAVFYRSLLLKRGFLRHVQKMYHSTVLRNSNWPAGKNTGIFSVTFIRHHRPHY